MFSLEKKSSPSDWPQLLGFVHPFPVRLHGGQTAARLSRLPQRQCLGIVLSSTLDIREPLFLLEFRPEPLRLQRV